MRMRSRCAAIVTLLQMLIGIACHGNEITEKQLLAAAAYSKARRGLAFLVMQHGRIIFEDYQGGANEPHPIYSGTKSFWIIAAMVAVKEGLLALDEPVATTITEWKNDPLKSRIRIRELLNFTDGIEPASFLHRSDIPDRNRVALALPVVAEPGTRFLYGPSHTQIFGELLRRKLLKRGTTPLRYLQDRVLDPLGLNHVESKVDQLGHPLLATGFKLTARQWLHLGATILQHGNYNGHEVLPSAVLKECFQPSAANPEFGMGFWLNGEAVNAGARDPDIENLLELKWNQANWSHACICRDAPADMIVSLGSSYQRLYVIPSLDVVVARQGMDAKFSDAAFLRLLLAR